MGPVLPCLFFVRSASFSLLVDFIVVSFPKLFPTLCPLSPQQHNIENETLQYNVLRVCRHASAVHECVLAIECLQAMAENDGPEEDSNMKFFKSLDGDKKRLNAELCSCTLQLMEATKHVMAWLDR